MSLLSPPSSSEAAPIPIGEFEQVFEVWPAFRVIVCKGCRHAVVPTYIRGHLKERYREIAAAT